MCHFNLLIICLDTYYTAKFIYAVVEDLCSEYM